MFTFETERDETGRVSEVYLSGIKILKANPNQTGVTIRRIKKTNSKRGSIKNDSNVKEKC